ncbi:hypothetical protein COEREDRAFT_95001 [Coemansia reversa NRRL 1564]|uniref:Probable DNA polymerase n=1 Tax=Coemansia reversa (strain ATCC 12441 / NRRL 1564) TaxID=763665 RepID=A0A2G5B0P1_COERN|nr:hypothetical protein COEREDRAFT_95001 [Coemansia reversa NRRL 1564]|eukprot:PIA12579.1 hypothetical protein COEREDRAFT_95001 [Coemansia reversa NRRL 1564]
MYLEKITRSVTGIVSFEYFLHEDEDVSYEEFYEIIREKIHNVNGMTGLTTTGINLCFLDQNSNMRYYAFDELDQLKEAILNADLDAAFGGSDEMPEDYGVILNTKRFRINSVDCSGGNRMDGFDSDCYHCIGIGGDQNNCLIECFKFFTGFDCSCEDVRKELGFKLTGKLGNKHIPELEKYFKLEVSVLLDEFDYNRNKDITLISPRIVYGDPGDTSSWLLFKDGHYDIILDVKNNTLKVCLEWEEKMKRKPTNESIYYFFDYETVWNPETYKLQPYSFGLIKTDKEGEILDQQFETLENTENIMMYLKKESIKERNKHKYLVGFNNSRFDNFLLLEEMLRKGDENIKELLFAGNTILNMKIYGFEVMDLCRILNTSLDKACKSFKCEQQKLSLEHNVVQDMFMKGELQQYLQKNYKKVKDYNLMDVKTLAELYFKIQEAVITLCGMNIKDFSTIAGMSYEIFKRKNKDKDIPIHGDMEKSMIRESVVGGRAQIFNKGEYNTEPLCCIDCVSLYPYVMLNNVFPIGETCFTEKYIENKIGVYKVEIITQPHISIIPTRTKNNPLDWESKDLERFLTSQDIDTLVKHGCKLEIVYGVYWNEDIGQLFKSYFTPLVEEKKRQDKLKEDSNEEYNAAIRELCKLLMNSLSGKLIQRDYAQIIEIVKGREGMNAFRQKCNAQISILEINSKICIVSGTLQQYINKMPTIYGSLIYSYARSHMYNTILSKVDYNQLYGMDTDSAFITIKQYLHLRENHPRLFGNEFGQFKEEVIELLNEGEEGPFGIFVAPKCYCFYAIHTNSKKERLIKARFKGININRDRIWGDKDFKALNGKQLHELYHSDTLPHIDVNFYRKCLNEDVTVLHSNLNKTIMNKDEFINIKQHFCLKIIKCTN